MSKDFTDAVVTNDDADDLLTNLELRSQNDVTSARKLVAQRTKTAVTIRPGNVCDRQDEFVLGTTTELRRQSMACLTSNPVMVGNVFHIGFDRTLLDVSPTLGVCDRCTMLGEASFELRFQFVQPIPIASTAVNAGE